MSIEEGELLQDSASSALARKRRMKRMGRRTGESGDMTSGGNKRLRGEDDEEYIDPDEISSGPRKKPHPTGIKRQARYDPGVPMTRDELTAWRKEARRVRNRESAAASRRRTRNRIEELEEVVSGLTTKYKAALQRIMELEAEKSAGSSSPATPKKTSQDNHANVTPCPSVEHSPTISPKQVSPSNSPRTSFSLNDDVPHEEQVEKKYQHIMNMIRPTAAKIPGADTLPSSPVLTTDEPLFQTDMEDLAVATAASCGASDASTTSVDMASDTSTSSDIDELEMGEFLADALTDFDPLSADVDIMGMYGV